MKRLLPATLLALLMLAPPGARACEAMHELAFDFEGGRHEVFMNGVYIMGGEDGGAGGRPLWPFQFMKAGENEVTVRLLDAGAAAKVSIQEGCRGSFERKGPLDAAELKGESEATLTFTPGYPVAAEYMRGAAEGADGLLAAVEALQAAAEAGDVAAVKALHRPMIVEAGRMGMPVEQFDAMLGWYLTKGKTTLRRDLAIEAHMDGKVFVVTAPDRQAPLTILVEDKDGATTWRSGIYWAKIDGKWGVLSTF